MVTSAQKIINRILLKFVIAIVFICFFINTSTVFAAGTGSISAQTCTGESFLTNADSNGKIKLTGNVTITTPIVISYGKNITIDLNGYVLKSNAIDVLEAKVNTSGYIGYDSTITNDLCRVLVVYGNLTINDSNPTKENKGTLTTVTRWIDKRLDSSKLTEDGLIHSTSVKYKDRYYWSKTAAGKDGDITTADAKRFWIYDGKGSTIIKGGIITGGVNTSGGGIYVGGGNLTINGGSIVGNKAIRYIAFDANGYQTATANNGGGIYATAYGIQGQSNYRTSTVTVNGGSIMYNWCDSLGGGVALNSYTQFYMNSGNLSNNVAQSSGGGITVRGDSTFNLGIDVNNVYTKKSAPVISGNRTYSTRYHGGGGGIEVDGGSLSYVVGQVKNNFASGSGGGIYCYRGGSVSASTSNSIISGNKSGGAGGGVYLQYGDVTLDDCIIENNSSSSSGGAVGIRVGNFIMNGGRIANNSAGNHGGAVYITAQNNITPHYDIGSLGGSASIKGTLVDGNTAADHGGAIYVSVMNSTSNVNIDIISSTIINNKAGIQDDGDYGYGGAVYLSGGILTIKEDASIGKTEIYGNSADGGGAFYVEDKVRKSTDSPPPYSVDESKLTTETLNESGKWYSGLNESQVIKYSDTKEGKVIIESGEIYNNSAVKSDGGAIYVSGSVSSVELKSGELRANTAVGDGGAVCVSGGNMIISGGNVLNNQARSGGGVYISNGNITMNGGTISNNQATTYGGGIYASSDSQDLTVTILSGLLIGNISNNNGGGIGVNMEKGHTATITIGLEDCMGINDAHSHPIIKDNTANENGGGFWFNGENMIMNMYCGSIEKNIALLEEGSANIYQTGGKATVHSGVIGEGVIVIGGEYVYVPNDNIPEVYITYNSNIPNDIQEKIAQVTVGVNIYLPEKLYVWDNHILIGWSYVQEPSSMADVFIAGEPYTVTDKNVTVYAVWRVLGAGKIENPIIKSGKHYNEITGSTNILMASNASFTTQMVVNGMDPNIYANRRLEFDKKLPNGTTILMIDKTNLEDRDFYVYKVTNDDTYEIYLTEFVSSNQKSNFTNIQGKAIVDEEFLFIVELPIDNNITGPTQMTLIRESLDSEIATIEQKVSFTTTEKRNFDLTYEIIDNDSNEKNTINDTIKLTYKKTDIAGDDTRFNGKNLTLVISAVEGYIIPEDTVLMFGNNEQLLDADGKFVISFGNVVEDFETEFKLISDTIVENGYDLKIKAQLYSTNNITKPYLGEIVTKINEITLLGIEKVAIDLGLTGRVKYADEVGDTITLDYETLNLDESYDIILFVQKKNDLGEYVTNSSLVQSVSGGTNLGEGKYKLDLSDSGKIKITFLDNLILEEGTYRVYLEVKNDEKVILKVPYNFIILEKEEA